MSIIEIVVVFAIIGIVMAFVGPSAGAWIQNTQLRNAADSVLGGVQQARLEAIKRNRSVMFRLTNTNIPGATFAGSTAWDICIYDPMADACSAAADATLASKSASEGGENARLAADIVVGSNPAVPMALGANLPGTVTFDSFGRVSTSAANNLTRIDVRNPSMSAADERILVILIGTGGQVRMCDPKLDKTVNPQGCV